MLFWLITGTGAYIEFLNRWGHKCMREHRDRAEGQYLQVQVLSICNLTVADKQNRHFRFIFI